MSRSAQSAGAAVIFPPDLRTFLDRPLFASIATVNADGGPHLAFIWYQVDGDRILINSRVERHWPRNLERDGRISFGVRDPDNPTHWVGVQGGAERLRDGEAAVADIMEMCRRYDDGDPERFRGQNRVTFALNVERSYQYGA
jgi:PPOX class probable F420-dependent enzyme